LATVVTGSGCAFVVRIASPLGWGIDPAVNALVEAALVEAPHGRNLGTSPPTRTMRNRSEPIS
jgi:hypothetical protein